MITSEALFTNKPRFQRIILCGITSVNSQGSVNQKNFHVRYVKVLARWKIVLQIKARLGGEILDSEVGTHEAYSINNDR